MNQDKPRVERPDIDSIKARCEATDHGPWVVTDKWGVCYGSKTDLRDQFSIDDSSRYVENEIFIANSKTDIPELISYCSQLEQDLSDKAAEVKLYGELVDKAHEMVRGYRDKYKKIEQDLANAKGALRLVTGHNYITDSGVLITGREYDKVKETLERLK